MDWTMERLQQLRAEAAQGQARLVELQAEGERIRDQLLRIDGAIRVLEEQVSDFGAFDAAIPAKTE
jgi:predicted  nucleic acid-binding Zn-ribbon protein